MAVTGNTLVGFRCLREWRRGDRENRTACSHKLGGREIERQPEQAPRRVIAGSAGCAFGGGRERGITRVRVQFMLMHLPQVG